MSLAKHTLKAPHAMSAPSALIAVTVDLPSQAGYSVSMHCKIGRKGSPGTNEDATRLLEWCDYYWKKEHAGAAVYGDAVLTGHRPGSASERDLEAYAKMYVSQ
jgi:hypothetical protein